MMCPFQAYVNGHSYGTHIYITMLQTEGGKEEIMQYNKYIGEYYCIDSSRTSLN